MEEMGPLPRSEHEQMKREIVELRAIVRQLEVAIALLKGGKNSRISSTAPLGDIAPTNSIILLIPTVVSSYKYILKSKSLKF